MTTYRLSLLIAGAVCAAIIAFASAALHGPALANAALPVPLGLATLALLLATYGVGVGLGWLLWGRRGR